MFTQVEKGGVAMREIKFRAWHKKMQRMFGAEELGRDQLTLSADGRGFVNVSGTDTRKSVFYGDVMIPLECTALHDKNEVEIYEGDILKTPYGTFEEAWTDEDGYATAGLQPRWIGEYKTIGWFDVAKCGEIIGNRYENPDLLK